MNFLKDKKIFLFLFITIIIFLQGLTRIPVLDRDEARFATSSKTMIETNDFIDIKMHNEYRYKKPVGIYWTQVLSNYFFGEPPYDKIWVYRIPSLFGIILSLFLIFISVKKIFAEKEAILSILFLVLSLLTISEVHQAKTDGFLFLFIVICNLLSIRLINEGKLDYPLKIAYFVSIAFGILVKGPIIFIFTVLPLLVFSVVQKKNFLKLLWTKFGLLIFLIISVPWFVLITIKSGGVFWHESLLNDLFNKVTSGQESHGFIPGYYTILIFLFFWPASIFIPNLILNMKKNFRSYLIDDQLRSFLIISSFIPFFIYEIIPTKLPHYVFPCYASLSILVSSEITKKRSSDLLRFSLIPLVIFPITILIVIGFAIYEYSTFDLNFFIITFFFLSLIGSLIFFLKKKKIKELIIICSAHQLLVYFSAVLFLVPRLETFWIAKNINDTIDLNNPNYEVVYHFGFNEPSLLFYTSHKAEKMNIIDINTNEIKEKRILYIVTDNYSNAVEKKFLNFKKINEIKGFNYSQGKDILIKIYKNY